MSPKNEKLDHKMKKLDLLSDPKARKILVGCLKTPRSLKEISRIQDIPLAICCRIAMELEAAGMIKEVEGERMKGNKITFYKTVEENAFVDIKIEDFRVELNFSDKKTDLQVA